MRKILVCSYAGEIRPDDDFILNGEYLTAYSVEIKSGNITITTGYDFQNSNNTRCEKTICLPQDTKIDLYINIVK